MWKDDGMLDTWPKSTLPANYNPNQKQFEFFWPLTEQINLDLDYSNCDTKQKLSIATTIGTGLTLIPNGNTAAPVWTAANNIVTSNIEISEITFTLNKKPFIIKRLIYKFLGINWKVK